jgi:hypothetical protein
VDEAGGSHAIFLRDAGHRHVQAELAIREGLGDDDAQARALARSLIQLYRHGVRDPESLASAVANKAA